MRPLLFVLVLLLGGCASASREIAEGQQRIARENGGYEGTVQPLEQPVELAYGALAPLGFRIELLAERDGGESLESLLEGRVQIEGAGEGLALQADLLVMEINGRSFATRGVVLGSVRQRLGPRGPSGLAEGDFAGLSAVARRGDEPVLDQIGAMAREDIAGLAQQRFPDRPLAEGDRLAGTDEVLARFKLSGPIARLTSDSDIGLHVAGRTVWQGRPAVFARYRGGADLFLPQDPPAAARMEVGGYSVIDLASGIELEGLASLQVKGVAGAASGLNAVQRSRLLAE
ncbi:MAG: hypothetical protein KIT20_01910 [Alphaproteobacteria bacterium]|nr:hypothetical protein [Alphaproteobacteria bacterium]